MNSSNKGKQKKIRQTAMVEEPPPLLKEVSILIFPHHVCLLGHFFLLLLIDFFQVHEYPSCITGHVRDDVKFTMNQSSFGTFAQQMSSMGLTFDITFTEDELVGPPNWKLFDEKIMDGMSHLSAQLEFPPRPGHFQEVDSCNFTRWAIIYCRKHKKDGVDRYQFQLPAMTPSSYTLEHLVKNFAVDNPISSQSGTLPPSRLLVIGGLFWFIAIEPLLT